MTASQAKKLKEITDKIVKEYKPEKIILFGSWAWGKPGPDSDVDLFVIKDTKQPTLKRIESLDRIFSRRESPLDFLVYTPQQIKKRVVIGDFFVKKIINDGKVIYDKSLQK